MGYFLTSSPEMLFVSAGLFSEFLAMSLYARYKFKLRRLAGTGRRHAMDVAYRGRSIMGTAMIAIPVLLYWLWSTMYHI
jgi:hypothetical protein